jgi:hypothetical protein
MKKEKEAAMFKQFFTKSEKTAPKVWLIEVSIIIPYFTFYSL